MQEDEGLNDLVASTVEAESAADEAATAEPTGDGEQGTIPDAPVDDWQPPSKEEWEEARKHAEIGKRYAPYANDIDGLLRSGFRGPAQQAPQNYAPQPQPQGKSEIDEFDDIFPDPRISAAAAARYAASLDGLNSNPKLFEQIHRGLDKRIHGERRRKTDERMDRFEMMLSNLQAYNDEINPRRFLSSPEWQQSGKEYLDLRIGGLRDPDRAWELARKNAAKQGATPTQAVAAGDKAAAKVEASNATKVPVQRSPAPPAPAKRPAPANDKTLSATGRRPTSGLAAGSSSKRRSVTKDYAEAHKLVSAALEKFNAS